MAKLAPCAISFRDHMERDLYDEVLQCQNRVYWAIIDRGHSRVEEMWNVTCHALGRTAPDFLSGFTPLALVSPETPTRQWGCCS